MNYLFGNSKYAIIIYRCIYVAVVFIGTVSELKLIWSISDTMNGLMIIPNMIGVISLSGVVIKLTKEYFKNNK